MTKKYPCDWEEYWSVEYVDTNILDDDFIIAYPVNPDVCNVCTSYSLCLNKALEWWKETKDTKSYDFEEDSNSSEIIELIEYTVIPEKLKEYYTYRLSSLYEWIWLECNSSEFGLNLHVWDLILRSEILDIDFKQIMNIYWYEVYNNFLTDDFAKFLESNENLIRLIADWKIQIWFIDDYLRVILVTKWVDMWYNLLASGNVN